MNTKKHDAIAPEVAALVEQFEAGTLPVADFSHERHVLVAAYYVTRAPFDEAAETFKANLKRFIARHGADGYNETITRFWLEYVRATIDRHGPAPNIPELYADVSKSCANSKLIFDYFSPERLKSPEAKAAWVEPDLKAFDFASPRSAIKRGSNLRKGIAAGILAATLGTSVVVAQSLPPAEARHAVKSARIELLAPPDKVFPLFGPEGEQAWAEGWTFKVVHARDKTDEEGTVFTTGHENESDTIWMVNEFDRKSNRVEYVRFTRDSNVCRIKIRLSKVGRDKTAAVIEYDYTAVSEKGRHVVEQFVARDYDAEMRGWERAINHYLKTGRTLTHH